MKNLSQMVSRLVLAISLVALPLSYCEAKSDKIAKGITFSGDIVKHEPSGYGTLTMQSEHPREVVIEITGTFNGTTISQGKIEYKNLRIMADPELQREMDYTIKDIKNIRGVNKRINTIEGDFSLSHDKKWENISIEARSVTLAGSKDVNLGTITINKSCRKYSSFESIDFEMSGNSGYILLSLQKPMYHEMINMLGLDSSNYLTSYEYKIGKNYSLVNLSFYDSLFGFSDGTIFVCPGNYDTGNYTLKTPSGDDVIFFCNEYHNILKDFTIVDKEGNSYKGKDFHFSDGTIKLNITYQDGSKFTGSVKANINDRHNGMEMYQELKSCPASSVQFYTGTYTNPSGEATEYVGGLTKAEHDARVLADAKAKEEAKQEAKRKDEQARIAAHNELVRKYGKTFAEAIENDHIMVGMTTEMLNKMTLDWSLYYDGGSKKIYIGEQNMLADAFIKTFGGRSKKAYVTVVNNKVQSIVYK